MKSFRNSGDVKFATIFENTGILECEFENSWDKSPTWPKTRRLFVENFMSVTSKYIYDFCV